VCTDTGKPKLPGRVPRLILGEEEVDAAIRPIHVAYTVLESLLATDSVFEAVKKIV